jgi:hypothetical protein
MGATGIDFTTIGLVLAGVSFGVIGLMMAGGALWPQQSQQYKKQIGDVITGLVILMIGGMIVAAFGAV